MKPTKIIIWVALAFFLIALADYYPKISVGITSLLIIDVLLINSDQYVALLQQAGA